MERGGMENGDEWWAQDKLEHLLACFLITILVYAVLGRARHRILRRWSVPLSAVVSLAAGAAKEAGDEVGAWESAGGSVKDAVADVVGVVIACSLLFVSKRWSLEKELDRDPAVSMV